MTKSTVTLGDKYQMDSGRVFISANQALVRLVLDQARRDGAAGLKTAGYVSGYRGSPLGVFDSALWAAQKLLDEHDIRFVAGLNEELAVSALRGTQEIGWFGSKYDGVFGLWYGKGIGVDRACESLKLGNLEGSSPHGGFLAVAGDDHGGKSSDSAHQSEHTLIAAYLPILYPSNIGEIMEFGLFGWAMSRYSGSYVALKCITDTLDLTATAVLPDIHRRYVLPDLELPARGLNLRPNLPPLVEEEWVVNHRLPAAGAFARVNGIDRVVLDSERRSLGIIAAGKAYLDVREALANLGFNESERHQLGIRLYKPGLIWPLEREGLVSFAIGHAAVLVVEEKRPVLEDQVARHLYAVRADQRPALAGKQDLQGGPLLSSVGELGVGEIRRAIMRICEQMGIGTELLRRRATALQALEQRSASLGSGANRPAYFCSGCPHNTSTRLPEGSVALGGIGCHGLAAVVMDRDTMQFMPMGHEGANWVSASQFVETPHVFANMGDGTYSHSGILSIRAAVAAKANMTYKILYNDAVAMTGGQPVELGMSPTGVVRQLLSEGVSPVRLVSDNPEKYAGTSVSAHHRDELDSVQRELRQVKGVSAIVYEQTCAAEKRRRRKRGLMAIPDRRVFINPAVCEGCGDCSVQSNCISVTPLETEFGRKRQIDQSTCNKDYSCVKGFCPSFVTVEGATIASRALSNSTRLEELLASLPTPIKVILGEEGQAVLVTGIGGTGVLTLGALIGMAAHVENLGCTVLDMTGMAQKGGSVMSHIRFHADPRRIYTSRLSEGMTDVLIACDLIVGSSAQALRTVRPGRTAAIINLDVAPSGEFQSHKDMELDGAKLRSAVVAALAGGPIHELHATRLATELTGDSIGSNIFMLGYTAQRGLLPLSIGSLEEAIRLNGSFVTGNLRIFALGRLAAHDLAALERELAPVLPSVALFSVEDVVASRVRLLTGYQSARYAQDFLDFIDNVQQQLRARGSKNSDALVRQIALSLAQLMAYKDEYEVARLHAAPEFLRQLREQFSGNFKLKFHLAPPMLPGRAHDGRPRKRTFGAWMLPVFKILASLRRLRGTPFDPFGYTAERRMERALVGEYRALVSRLIERVDAGNLNAAVTIAAAARDIAGYGPVKDAAVAAYRERLKALLAAFEAAPVQARAA